MHPTTKPSVSFAPHAVVYDTLHIEDYTEAEHETCWYSPKEKQLILLEIKNTLNLIDLRKRMGFECIDNDAVCTRGLEIFDPTEIERRTESRTAIMKDVLFLQHECDSEELAKIYTNDCKNQQDRARIMGLADELCVTTSKMMDSRRQQQQQQKSSDSNNSDNKNKEEDTIPATNRPSLTEHRRSVSSCAA